MNQHNGATSLAEGQYEFKTDVNLIFGKQCLEKTHVLRTTLYSLPVWKTRNPGLGLSPFKDRATGVTKDASIIDGEVWIFGINASLAQGIVAAVKIASRYYNVKPSVLLSDIYAKNLNVEGENDMANQVLIRVNKNLYINTCKALADAARQLGISGKLNFYVFSKNNNPKIPKPDLVDALQSGGADSVVTDEHRSRVTVGNNQGTRHISQLTNFHLATLKV